MAKQRCEACDTTKDVERRSNDWDLCGHCFKLQQEATGDGVKTWGVYTVDGEGIGTVEAATQTEALVQANHDFKGQLGLWVEELDA
jgi:hypothetical protein